MPPVAGAYVAGSVFGLAAGTAAYVAVSTVVSLVVGLVINQVVSKVLGEGQDKGFSNKAQDRTVTVRQPAASRRIIYGETRAGGVYAFIHSATPVVDHVFASESYVIPASPHQVTVYGFILEPGEVSIDLGEENYEVLTEVSGTPGPGQYSRSGQVYTFNEGAEGFAVVIAFTTQGLGKPESILHLVVVLAGHQVEEIGTVYFDDEALTLGPDGTVVGGRYGAGYARVTKHLGAASQVADDMLLTLSADQVWTSAHRGDGIAYIAVQLVGSANVYPNGVPAISADVRGKNDIYDPRTGLRGYSNNASLCRANYLEDSIYGMKAFMPSEFDIPALIAAANIDDELVTRADGTQERRYTLNGIIDTAEEPESIIGKMNTACGGNVVWTGGQWAVNTAAYQTPTLVLTEADARDTIEVMPTLSRRNKFNAVKGLYVSPLNKWQPSDYPFITNATYQTADGERIYQDYDLPFTTSSATAQRLAKILLERSRQEITVEFPAKLIGARVRAGDTVYLTLSRFGWTNKVFEVVDWTFAAVEDQEGPALGTNLILRETAATVYDWNSGEETTVDLAPNTTLPNPFFLSQPALQEPVEILYETREGRGVAAKIVLTVIPDGRAAEYQFEYKLIGDPFFTVRPLTRGSSDEILDIAAGIYDFRVKGISALGVSSQYSQRRKEVTGLSGRPADITGLTMQAISALAILQWHQHPDLDVRRGGYIHIRHSEAMTGATWETSYTINDPVSGDSSLSVVPLKGGTYLLKARDSSGNESVNAATISTKDASTLNYSTIGSVQEDPTFTGTHSGTALTGTNLHLTGAGNLDAEPDFDAIANFDAMGGFLGVGTYTFDTGIDLTTVKRVRLFTELAISVFEAVTLFDSRTEPIDSWLDFDGTAAGGVGDCIMEVRETDDNPAGAPTWGPWKRITTGDYSARAFEFRAMLTSADPAYDVYVTKLRASAKEVIP